MSRSSLALAIGRISLSIVEGYLTCGAAAVNGWFVDIDGVLIHGAQGVRSLSVLLIARAAGSPALEGLGMYQPSPPHPPTGPTTKRDKLSAWDAVYSLNVGIACLITYWIITYLLHGFVDQASNFSPSSSSSGTPAPMHSLRG